MSSHGKAKGRHWIFFLDWGLDLHAVRFAIMGGVAFSAFRAMLTWIVPVPLKLTFDSVFANHPLPPVLSWMPANHTDRLYILVGATVVIAVLLGLTAYGADMLLAGAGQKVVFDLRTRLFRHLTAQSASFHHRRQQGDLLARLGGDVQAMQSVVVNVVPVVAENVLTVFGMLVIMFVLQWQFSLLAMSLLPVLWLVMRHYMASIKTAQRVASRNEGHAHCCRAADPRGSTRRPGVRHRAVRGRPIRRTGLGGPDRQPTRHPAPVALHTHGHATHDDVDGARDALRRDQGAGRSAHPRRPAAVLGVLRGHVHPGTPAGQAGRDHRGRSGLCGAGYRDVEHAR